MDRRAFASILISAIPVVSVSAFAQAKKTEQAKDPVCKLEVDKDPNKSAQYKGATYYFCSTKDRDDFKMNPEKYVGKK